jgi:hypothetical protein
MIIECLFTTTRECLSLLSDGGYGVGEGDITIECLFSALTFCQIGIS